MNIEDVEVKQIINLIDIAIKLKQADDGDIQLKNKLEKYLKVIGYC